MGCCESCASARRKDATKKLKSQLTRQCTADELRAAIADAESCGVSPDESLQARQRYCELAKQERQSPANLEEMLSCALHMQDGVMLYSVLTEAKLVESGVDLSRTLLQLMERARRLLSDLQDDEIKKLWRMSQFTDAETFASQIEHARHIGVAQMELQWAEQRLSEMPIRTTAGSPSSAEIVRRKSAP
mmetsp:Transcript_60218/g.111637  ORF Transcript_60218/g.111637 Transcript_60218/m.111637 type:complete len:189 (-) Transcript_60218:68-634(-)